MSKILLLKIFLLQRKNYLNFNLLLKTNDLSLLVFLWQFGYILGFSCIKYNFYTIFLNKSLKQFSINFVEKKLNRRVLYSGCKWLTMGVPLMLTVNGFDIRQQFTSNLGGFLLCIIF